MTKPMSKLIKAIGDLQIALIDTDLEPAKAIIVDRGTGYAIKSIHWNEGVDRDAKMSEDWNYCGHICGVPFFIEEPKPDPRDKLPPYYNKDGN